MLHNLTALCPKELLHGLAEQWQIQTLPSSPNLHLHIGTHFSAKKKEHTFFSRQKTLARINFLQVTQVTRSKPSHALTHMDKY